MNTAMNATTEQRQENGYLIFEHNGKFGITTNKSTDECIGQFQLFNIETGEEINTCIKKEYKLSKTIKQLIGIFIGISSMILLRLLFE